jgi:dTDP-4-amino-4,6-dideoxygalactose transaminase
MMTTRWPLYKKSALQAIAQVADRNEHVEFADNQHVNELEAEICRLFKRRFAVCVNSGTSGLMVAYAALSLPPGTRVLAPAYTFFATVTAMLPSGLEPQLLDLDPDTLNVCIESACRHTDSGAGAMVITHNWGNAVTRQQMQALKDTLSIPLIDDCSHMCGTAPDSEFFDSGSPADISVVSLGARKIVSGGSGGVVLTDDENIYDRILALCQPQRSRHYFNPSLRESLSYMTLGMNFRISPLSAVLALDHIRRLDLVRSAWQAVGSRITERVGERLRQWRLPDHDGRTTCWYKVPMICREGPADVRSVADALADIRVSIDSPVEPFFTLPGFPHRQPLSVFPHYQRALGRMLTLDLSNEVARQYQAIAPQLELAGS